MSQTKHTVTAHGEVEYETKTCASCDMEYLPEDTKTFYHGEMDVRLLGIDRDDKYEFKSEPSKIVICENCIEEPQKISIESFAIANGIGILSGVFTGWILIGIFLL